MDLRHTLICGVDLSSLGEVEACGGAFFDFGSASPEPAPVILSRHGWNLIRLRLWNDPYDEQGRAYGAGTNDLAATICLAARAKALGLPWMLDFHYSDFWADPGKQYPPKAWADLDVEGLEQVVYDYTARTMTALRDADLLPDLVAPGNELSNGLLGPLGRVPAWENLTRFVSAGIRAVRDTAPTASVMLHLDNGGNQSLYREWFEQYSAHGGADFDCIGLSYYPFWHGTLADLRGNLHALAERWGKPLIVAETSTAFTLEDCSAYEGLRPDQKRGLAVGPSLADRTEYPITPGGQAAFLRDLWQTIRQTPHDLGRGLIWWEPAWLPVPGSGWTTPAGLAYVREAGPGGNEWANQALFDYEGHALPALKILEKN